MKTSTHTFMFLVASTMGLVSATSLTAVAEVKRPPNPQDKAASQVIANQQVFRSSRARRVASKPADVIPPKSDPSQPQVSPQPFYYPMDMQAGAAPQPMTGDELPPAAPMDTPGDAAIKIQHAQILAQQARLAAQQARALTNENNLKQTEGMLSQKKMWSDDRLQSRLDREARLAHGQRMLAERRRTVYRQAYQLSPSELNLATGTIAWPTALQNEAFEGQRNHMSELFRQLVTYRDSSPATLSQISKIVDGWSRELKSQTGSVSREDYLGAQKFLLGLKYTAESLAETT